MSDALGGIMDGVTNIASSSGDQWNQMAQWMLSRKQFEKEFELAEDANRRANQQWAIDKMMREMMLRQGLGQEQWKRRLGQALAQSQGTNMSAQQPSGVPGV